MIFKQLLAFVLIFLSSFLTSATEYALPQNGSKLIGEDIIHHATQGEYFQKLSEEYNVGFLALMAANPSVDPFLLKQDQQVVIPKQMILPFAKREGIVINVAELRLYYFSPNKQSVHVFPIGIGKQGLSTPKVISFISDKRKDPPWRPTEQMKQRHFAETGKKLADVIPAGPNNPFGKYALRIGNSHYLIHGSNQRFGIGMRASSGCIRLFDDDIEWLYENVAVDTLVRIVEQPIKMAYLTPNKKLIEIHEPLTSDDEALPSVDLEFTKAVKQFIGNNAKAYQQVEELMKAPTGLVSTLMTAE